ncbi:MAG: phosphopantothenoylcysteine decarboxylase [Spirochaetota bacterium]
MKHSSFSDYSFVVTAGPTREWFDPFRYISNPSSGRMGIAFADAAYSITHNVTLIHGPVCKEQLSGKKYRMIYAESTSEMRDRVIENLTEGTVLVMAAAPADFTPSRRSGTKIKKKDAELTVQLANTPDILMEAGEHITQNGLTDIIRVGFAAETDNIYEYAKKKLIEKGLDFICLNDISKEGSGFSSETNEIILYSKNGEAHHFTKAPKTELAYRILEKIAEYGG